MSPTSYNLSLLRAGIKPFRLHWFPRLASTNTHAAALRKRGTLFAPSIVLTGHQLAGRGRGTNTWWSAPGAITATFVLPVEEHLSPHQIPLVAGLAVRNAIAEQTARDIQLKWPNDIYFDGRKLAGLLCQRIDKADLIGLGLNVNVSPADAPRALRDKITSLLEITATPQDLTQTLIAITRHLQQTMARRAEQPFAVLLREYDRHHALNGRRIAVLENGRQLTGRCEGIDSIGRLILKDKSTTHRIITGQVMMM
ncbi:MAG TPA: biotin--[acetyl-CoA-carboxylase] ligase [Tepidisphaeraceae bacterium]|jgi:BirA family biotin operon repressor/biotin-[acetyl-CoA-carboxylase] ligase